MADHQAMARRPTTLLALLCALAFGAAGCGDDESSDVTVTVDASSEALIKPEVEVPEGDPPKELEVSDITEGDGTEAQSGDLVTVQYVGVNYSTGEEFDSSFDSSQPFTFQLGSGMVIPGWDEGIPGMKVGGRRELVIPPDQAYGAQGSPPAIGPNETLVFVVDMVDVK